MAINLKLRNLLYVIHAVPPERVAELMPKGVALDVRETPDGPRAFLATVALEAGAAFPYILTGFRQVNYRIFVRHLEEPGVLFVRSWVSARAAAAVLSLAIPTEHASVDTTIDNADRPYGRYQVLAHSGDHHLALDAHADPSVEFGYFGSRNDAIHFLTHRLNGFTAGAHPKTGLSVIRVSHSAMNPISARVTVSAADQWTDAGILTPDEARHPALALIQPETQFDMNLPEKLAD
ncbi:MAG TPA: DUF2071 domain-containing protein [Terriglobales bacterium]|nr:DUF2071 domain-containing protein [Terriglobales bacterium]